MGRARAAAAVRGDGDGGADASRGGGGGGGDALDGTRSAGARGRKAREGGARVERPPRAREDPRAAKHGRDGAVHVRGGAAGARTRRKLEGDRFAEARGRLRLAAYAAEFAIPSRIFLRREILPAQGVEQVQGRGGRADAPGQLGEDGVHLRVRPRHPRRVQRDRRVRGASSHRRRSHDPARVHGRAVHADVQRPGVAADAAEERAVRASRRRGRRRGGQRDHRGRRRRRSRAERRRGRDEGDASMGGEGGRARGGDRRAGADGDHAPARRGGEHHRGERQDDDRARVPCGVPAGVRHGGAVNRVRGGAQQLKLEAAVSYGLVVTKDG
mmetsp:Transcript_7201/g.31768  ORF Transcript_7201/g.31768 Transcript_7201/m.31768 type:complete len:328 (-) Transcript_7201:63-1046(-)